MQNLKKIRRYSLVVTVVLFVITIGYSIAAPQFREMFQSFGADLPGITYLIINNWPVIFILPILSAVVYLYSRGKDELSEEVKRQLNWVVTLILFSSALFIPVFIYAMYAPVFKLGAVVGGDELAEFSVAPQSSRSYERWAGEGKSKRSDTNDEDLFEQAQRFAHMNKRLQNETNTIMQRQRAVPELKKDLSTGNVNSPYDHSGRDKGMSSPLASGKLVNEEPRYEMRSDEYIDAERALKEDSKKREVARKSLKRPVPPPPAPVAGFGGATGFADASEISVDGIQEEHDLPAEIDVPDSFGTLAQSFVSQRNRLDSLSYQDPTGYWENTYIPGDPIFRRLHHKYGHTKQPALLARQYWQPFDPPGHAALAVYVSADQRAINGRSRVLMQVGLKGTSQAAGLRPAMNVGIVLDIRSANSVELQRRMRTMALAFAKAKQAGDQFSLTVVGRSGGVLVPAHSFRLGTMRIAMEYLFGNVQPEALDPKQYDLLQGMKKAYEVTGKNDDPSGTLGSSLVILVTADALMEGHDNLQFLAHENAVAGVPTSVISVSENVPMEGIDQIILAGQGHRRILTDINEAESIAERELNDVSRAVARAIRLNIRLAAGVKLIDVIGSKPLNSQRSEQLREAEQSLDRRMAKNYGIEADRGKDDDGIQIIIPSYYAGDDHVFLLDLVVEKPGAVADVTLKYKDLVYMNNGVTRAHLDLGRVQQPQGPLQFNVWKNLLALKLAETAKSSAQLISQQPAEAVSLLEEHMQLLQQMQQIVPAWQQDEEIQSDIQMLKEFVAALRRPDNYQVRETLLYAAMRKTLSSPQE